MSETLNPSLMENLKRKRGEDDDSNSEPPKSESEVQQHPHPLSKTSLCSYFRGSKCCSHGESCRYAHGESELRPRPDGTWDPTSQRYNNNNHEQVKEDDVAVVDIMMTEALDVGDEALSSSLSKCLVNLPMKWSSDQLRNFLNEQGILFKSAKKKKGMIVGFVTFQSADQAKAAAQELDGKSIGNNRTLKVSDVIPRQFEKQTSPVSDQSNMNQDTEDAHSVPNGSALKGRSVRDAVTPLAHMSYTDQLEHKKNSLMQTLKRLTRNARKACPNGVSLPDWILRSREIGGLPCKLEGIIESPVIDGYRNKCEFSVGYSLQGKPTVGFLLGNFREGVTAVEEPVSCPNVSRISCRYAAMFQEFLQNSCLPVWNRLNNTGFWRQLTVREGRRPADVDKLETNMLEVLLIVQVCTMGSNAEQVKGELEHLTQAFSVGSTTESPPLPLTALVIQDHTGISNAAPSDAPLLYVLIRKEEGECRLQSANDVVEPRIHDCISNLQFSISPSAFFQVNTLAAEKLYSLAGDWASLGPDTLLFDICCGTGTIGLTLAHRVGMVVGVEMNASAVTDAQRNAELNSIKNCRFVCGKAEDVIGSLMKEYLSQPQKLDEICVTSQNNETDVNAADSALGPKEISIVDHENDSSPNKCPEDENPLQEHCTSEGGSTPVQQFKNVVAIVDPPRVGLHPTVIKVLRTQSRLRRLVYISCNPESLVANAIELCTPSSVDKGINKNNSRGWRNMSSAGLARQRTKSMPTSDPFKPIKAMAVDLFPHTPHCELVMLLER